MCADRPNVRAFGPSRRYPLDTLLADARRRRDLRRDLRDALARGEFELEYQPIVRCDTRQVIACEALLRWNHPALGRIMPDEFIPLAEEGGLMVAIGAWVLEEACRECASWVEPLGIAVNLSAAQFRVSDIVETVSAALAAAGLPATRLQVEITETCLLAGDAWTREAVDRIRGLGVRIAMDDFGVGFSSLSCLNQFPFDTVKVDRSFVKDSAISERARLMLQAIVGLARVLDLRIVVEGVETADQLAFVRSIGVTEIQGFVFSRPASAASIRQALAGQVMAAAA
jgi:EAL domain-containing protein (putative c-di-GMP-specific phosphodiesterase class I)